MINAHTHIHSLMHVDIHVVHAEWIIHIHVHVLHVLYMHTHVHVHVHVHCTAIHRQTQTSDIHVYNTHTDIDTHIHVHVHLLEVQYTCIDGYSILRNDRIWYVLLYKTFHKWIHEILVWSLIPSSSKHENNFTTLIMI